MTEQMPSSPVNSEQDSRSIGGSPDRGWVSIKRESSPPSGDNPEWRPEEAAMSDSTSSPSPPVGQPERTSVPPAASSSWATYPLRRAASEPPSRSVWVPGAYTNSVGRSSPFTQAFGDVVDTALINRGGLSNIAAVGPGNASAAAGSSQRPAIRMAIRFGNAIVWTRSPDYYEFIALVQAFRENAQELISGLEGGLAYESADHTVNPRCARMAEAVDRVLTGLTNIVFLGDVNPHDHTVFEPDMRDLTMMSMMRDIAVRYGSFVDRMNNMRDVVRAIDAGEQFVGGDILGAAAFLRRRICWQNATLWHERVWGFLGDSLAQLEAAVPLYRQEVHNLEWYMRTHRTTLVNLGPLDFGVSTVPLAN